MAAELSGKDINHDIAPQICCYCGAESQHPSNPNRRGLRLTSGDSSERRH